MSLGSRNFNTYLETLMPYSLEISVHAHAESRNLTTSIKGLEISIAFGSKNYNFLLSCDVFIGSMPLGSGNFNSLGPGFQFLKGLEISIPHRV